MFKFIERFINKKNKKKLLNVQNELLLNIDEEYKIEPETRKEKFIEVRNSMIDKNSLNPYKEEIDLNTLEEMPETFIWKKGKTTNGEKFIGIFLKESLIHNPYYQHTYLEGSFVMDFLYNKDEYIFQQYNSNPTTAMGSIQSIEVDLKDITSSVTDTEKEFFKSVQYYYFSKKSPSFLGITGFKFNRKDFYKNRTMRNTFCDIFYFY